MPAPFSVSKYGYSGHAVAGFARSIHLQRGLSLIELMVAITISLLLLTGLTSIYLSNSRSRSELDKSTRQIENGRYAMELLSDDIRHAGFYGPMTTAPSLPASITALPDPCYTALDGSADDLQSALGLPLQGYAGTTTAAALDTKLGCLKTAAVGYKPNTAVMVVRRIATTAGLSASNYNMQVSSCPGDPAPGWILSKTSTDFTLHKNASPGCTPISGAPTADIVPYFVHIYYVSTCSGTDCTAAGAVAVPTLKRIELGTTAMSAPVPLVDGIENLQFEYGVDNTNDGAPDVYMSAPAFADWRNVMSVRVSLLSRSSEPTTGYTDAKAYQIGPVTVAASGDSYKRHAYSELVRLNNPAGRRE
ncbi:MAG: PilW family protein [Rhodocyclaceae bacterium]|nr:PilW family protein [Rhodocyclaceae bacterium]MBX3667506.1 PilW family protein [Rhodocyclaceae bacterium]